MNELLKSYDDDNHVILDIETLGTGNNCVIPSISAIRFNPITGEEFSSFDIKLQIQPQLDKHRSVSEGTLKFWLNQSKEAQQRVFFEGIEHHPSHALIFFSQWLSQPEKYPESFGKHSILRCKNVKMIGNGPAFDLTKVDTLFLDFLECNAPWSYYNERCMRTIVAMAPWIKKEHIFQGTPHVGIDDCRNQASTISKTLQYIKSLTSSNENEVLPKEQGPSRDEIPSHAGDEFYKLSKNK